MHPIVVEGLRKRYGNIPAVDDISFEVRAGEIFALLGPNGAGKTTTTEILEGLLAPDEGAIHILGLDIHKDLKRIKQRVGIQLQSTALFRLLTVREHLTLFASFYERALPVEQALRLVQLEEKAECLTTELSGGQRQRLAIGLGLVNDPDVVFLDEPTTGLDPQVRAHLLEVILGLRARGKTIFMTTHYMEEAERICDRVAVIDHGKLLACASPRGLVEEYFEYPLVELTSSTMTRAALSTLPGVHAVQEGPAQSFVMQTREPAGTVGALWNVMRSARADVRDLRVRRASLEDVFLKLTGRPLRE